MHCDWSARRRRNRRSPSSGSESMSYKLSFAKFRPDTKGERVRNLGWPGLGGRSRKPFKTCFMNLVQQSFEGVFLRSLCSSQSCPPQQTLRVRGFKARAQLNILFSVSRVAMLSHNWWARVVQPSTMELSKLKNYGQKLFTHTPKTKSKLAQKLVISVGLADLHRDVSKHLITVSRHPVPIETSPFQENPETTWHKVAPSPKEEVVHHVKHTGV